MINVEPALWLTVGMVVAFGATAVQEYFQPEPPTQSIEREQPWTDVLVEHDDGHGLAVQFVDDGVEICAFEPGDTIYQSVWIGPDELAPLADALSEQAAVNQGGERP